MDTFEDWYDEFEMIEMMKALALHEMAEQIDQAKTARDLSLEERDR